MPAEAGTPAPLVAQEARPVNIRRRPQRQTKKNRERGTNDKIFVTGLTPRHADRIALRQR